MQHFPYLDDREREAIFAVPPRFLPPSAPLDLQGVALGATIYSPATRPALDLDSRRLARIGATSHVWCLEDAVPHAELAAAERNVVTALRRLARPGASEGLPQLFVRVREAGQLRRLVAGGGTAARLLTGVVLPKFSLASAGQLDEVAELSEHLDHQLLAMPVLETPAIAWVETRQRELLDLRSLCEAHRDRLLAVRVGATDLCGLFGLRRDAQTAIWDIAVVRDALADVVNVFGRGGRDAGHVVAGPVWEHFDPGADESRQPLPLPRAWREPLERDRTPPMPNGGPDPLRREVGLDIANGMTGKTVVHPRHVGIVNALLTVGREDYDDAVAVAAAATVGGAFRSEAGNKMNEAGPHALWARAVLRRAAAYGVLAAPDRLEQLLAAGRRAHDAAFPQQAPAWPADRLVL